MRGKGKKVENMKREYKSLICIELELESLALAKRLFGMLHNQACLFLRIKTYIVSVIES